MIFTHTETSLEKENAYPKLVRDKIPEVVANITGKKVSSRIMTDNVEYLSYLMQKVEEEVYELVHAEGKEHVVEEISDVLELIDALIAFYGVDMDEVKSVQKEKREKRGGFKERVLMLEKVEE